MLSREIALKNNHYYHHYYLVLSFCESMVDDLVVYEQFANNI